MENDQPEACIICLEEMKPSRSCWSKYKVINWHENNVEDMSILSDCTNRAHLKCAKLWIVKYGKETCPHCRGLISPNLKQKLTRRRNLCHKIRQKINNFDIEAYVDHTSIRCVNILRNVIIFLHVYTIIFFVFKKISFEELFTYTLYIFRI